MTAKRILIVANEAVAADRSSVLPEVVSRQVGSAGEVRVIAPTLTTRLESWASDTDAAARSANRRMRAIVRTLACSGRNVAGGFVGDEDPVQAIADALVTFPADAVVLATHATEGQNHRERRLRERVRARFRLPVAEMRIDRNGCVVSVSTDDKSA